MWNDYLFLPRSNTVRANDLETTCIQYHLLLVYTKLDAQKTFLLNTFNISEQIKYMNIVFVSSIYLLVATIRLDINIYDTTNRQRLFQLKDKFLSNKIKSATIEISKIMQITFNL